jgi:sugar O-acyltransferase (sialic acid O-acetyltransferase NeuD family)
LHLPTIVIGGSGHAKVLVSTLLMQHRTVIGFVDVNAELPQLLGIPYLGDDAVAFLHRPDEIRLVNGIGSARSAALRQAIYERFREKQYKFETVIHPSAVIAPDVEIDHGTQIMAGVVVQPGTWLGENVIINTRACIDHDCLIDAHAHVAPGSTLCGHVHVGRAAHIGAGATIIQGIKIGAAAVVGAGAVVVRNVPAGVTVVGVPAVPLMRPVAFG